MQKISMLLAMILLFASTSIFAQNRDLGVNVPGVKVAEHLYRSTAQVHQVIKYLRKKGTTAYQKEVLETPRVFVTHLKSLKSKSKWEGINIYRYKKLTYIYIIPRKK